MISGIQAVNSNPLLAQQQPLPSTAASGQDSAPPIAGSTSAEKPAPNFVVEKAPSKGAAPPAPPLNKQPSKKKKAPVQPSIRELRKREEDERRQRILEELQRKKESEEKRREEKKRILETNARRKEEKRNQEQQLRENKRSSMLEDIKKRQREMKDKKSEFDVQIYGLGGSQKIEEEEDNSAKAGNDKQPLQGFEC